MPASRTAPHTQRGFSLLEILVTIVVVALGLLGFAGLQVYSLKSNRIALHRSQATLHAHDLIDRMRANRAVAIAGTYNQDYTVTACSADPSLPGNVAGDDLAEWNNSIACNFPTGAGKITVSNTGTVTLWIKWKEGTSSSDPDHIWSTETSL